MQYTIENWTNVRGNISICFCCCCYIYRQQRQQATVPTILAATSNFSVASFDGWWQSHSKEHCSSLCSMIMHFSDLSSSSFFLTFLWVKSYMNIAQTTIYIIISHTCTDIYASRPSLFVCSFGWAYSVYQ